MSNVVQLAPIPAEVRERIEQTAEALYVQAGRQTIPTVDQVRRTARVDMNAASSVMREWRRQLIARAAPTLVHVPEAIATVHTQALAGLWLQAQALANESLQAERAAWEGERAQADVIRQELATAYETQAAELEQAVAHATAAEIAHRESIQRAGTELAEVRAELVRMLTHTERAEARADELEHRADELARQLTRVQDEAAAERTQHVGELGAARSALDQTRGELASVAAKAEAAEHRHVEQRKQTAQEALRIAERMTRAEADRDHARKDGAQAREQSARLQGQLDTMQQQTSELLRVVGTARAVKPPKNEG